MKILAFETSCDDTAVAIVKNGNIVLGATRISQTAHEVWGGVVPEIAARLHSENWKLALENCLEQANCTIKDITAIACTHGPGLQTSLLSGTTAASFFSLLYQKPLIPVHHVYGHLCSLFLERNLREILFPILVLTVSGGHTSLYLWKNATTLQKVGETLDDAAGEAFDKVAKMLNLGYPGGPMVAEHAKKGDSKKYLLPKIYLKKKSLNFSFSGLKAAVRRFVDEEIKKSGKFSESFISDICASFELTVGKIFLKKLEWALEKFPETVSIGFVGGVSANTYLRSEINNFSQYHCKNLVTPLKIEYSTDNAAMIASGAYFLYQANPQNAKIQFLNAESRLEI